MNIKKFEENEEEKFDRYYKEIEKMLDSGNACEKDLRDPKLKYGRLSYGHEPKIIMDTFIYFFLRFYILLQRLPEQQDGLRKFIDFPNVTRITAPIPMRDEDIIKETLESAREAFDYFDRTADESFTNHMERYLDESCARTLFNRTGKYYDFDKTEAVVFAHKGKIANELMKIRVKINYKRGRKPHWTPELRKDFLNFYNICLKIIQDAKASLTKFKGTTCPDKHLGLEYPQIPDDILELFFVSGKRSEPAEIAITWTTEQFGVERTTTIRNSVLPLARKEIKKG